MIKGVREDKMVAKHGRKEHTCEYFWGISFPIEGEFTTMHCSQKAYPYRRGIYYNALQSKSLSPSKGNLLQCIAVKKPIRAHRLRINRLIYLSSSFFYDLGSGGSFLAQRAQVMTYLCSQHNSAREPIRKRNRMNQFEVWASSRTLYTIPINASVDCRDFALESRSSHCFLLEINQAA